jgi:hypothetical protein
MSAIDTHSTAACAPSPPGPKTTVGIPLRDQGRVGPVALADDLARARVRAHQPDDLLSLRDLERVSGADDPPGAVEVRVVLAQPLEQRLQLAFHL